MTYAPRLRLVATLLIVVPLGACQRPSYEVRRPWRDGPKQVLESAEIEHVTHSALRIHQPAATMARLPLGAVEPGWFSAYVGLPSGTSADASVTLQLEVGGKPAGGACTIRSDGAPAWQGCRLAVDRAAKDAVVEVHGAEVSGDVFISSPVLTARTAQRHSLVFVLLLDTVRADRLMTFNSALPIGAALDKLSREAITFEHVRSESSWTRTAVATLMTGLSPMTHQVFGRSAVLGPEVDTLGEILQRHGYQSIALSTNPNILPLWGFGQGFDTFVDIGAEEWTRSKTHAARVFEHLRSVIGANGHEPWLYYLHFMDAHGPYAPGAAALQRVHDDGRLAESFPGKTAPASGKDPEKVATDYGKYLGELLDLDAEIGVFIDYLKAQGWYDEALILVVADHGEEFLDHGDVAHGKTLYDEVLRVPVLLKLPRQAAAGTRVHSEVGLADLLPTVLQVLGIPVPDHLDGRALLMTDGSLQALPSRPQVAMLKLDDHFLASVVDGNWKLIVNYRDGDQLFDLQNDPLEHANHLAGGSAQAERLRTLLDARMAGREQGWHVRGCGADLPVIVHFSVGGAIRSVRGMMFEPDDSLNETPSGGTARLFMVTMNLSQRRVKQELFGQLLDRVVRDEDELVILGDSDAPLTLRGTGPLPLAVALGSNGPRTAVREVQLDTLAQQRDLVRPSDAVECFAPATGPASAADRPYLRIWYVAPPRAIAEASIDPSVAERLRALGYGKPE